MGRKKKNTVYRYFDLMQNGTAKCLVPECGKSFTTHHGANLLKHLKYMHKDEFKTIEELNKSRDIGSNTGQTRTISEIVIQECTNLVAVHGRPFTLINDRAFQNLISLIPNNRATVNAVVIKENVQYIATKMRDDLGNTLRDKFLSLKVDIASLATRSFMGINCQYIENGQVILRNLGMIEIFLSHTAQHLKDLLIFNLHRFHITPENNKQIYCITTDNGANMLKMSKLLNEAVINQSHEERGGINQNVDSDSDNNDYMISEDLEEPFIEIEELADVLSSEFESSDTDYGGIGIVRCAAHTLQLALQDTGNEVTISNLISRCREIVLRLRTSKFVRLIREKEKLVPKLDCSTRWHSKIDMVESLLPLRDICDMDSRLYLPSTTWNELKIFVRSMLPAKQLTKKLQDEQLIVGDFYIAWMMCIIELTKIATPISCILKAKMKEREKALLENNVFLNAIFLDPRVNSILTKDQQNKAKENLKKLYTKHFETENRPANSFEPFSSGDSSNRRETIDARDELEDFLNISYINSHRDLSEELIRSEDLNQSVTSFLNEPLLKSTENVIKYWEKSRDKFPLLYKLAKIVLSAPMTQVSVERLFSSLKFVVSNYRLSLKSDVIDDLLFIRSNTIFNK